MIFYFYSILVHCRNLHPIFRKVAEKYRENDKIIFARMDLGEFKPFDLKVSFLAALGITRLVRLSVCFPLCF